MDENPAHFKDGEIIVHPQVIKYMKAGGEMGLLSGSFPYEKGGMQLPGMVSHASAFIQDAANNHLPGYIGLTVGAAELISHFGSQELNDTYLPNMLSGQWGGTIISPSLKWAGFSSISLKKGNNSLSEKSFTEFTKRSIDSLS